MTQLKSSDPADRSDRADRADRSDNADRPVAYCERGWWRDETLADDIARQAALMPVAPASITGRDRQLPRSSGGKLANRQLGDDAAARFGAVQ